jgi:hypothetical protein
MVQIIWPLCQRRRKQVYYKQGVCQLLRAAKVRHGCLCQNLRHRPRHDQEQVVGGRRIVVEAEAERGQPGGSGPRVLVDML